MNFEEKGGKKYCISSREFNIKDFGYIYFLIKNEEVVYVGQTRVGISRPLTHKDKEYDYFYLKKCHLDELTSIETEMILKYKPKYNNTFSQNKKIIHRNEARNILLKKGFPIRVLFYKKALERLNIKEFNVGSSFCIDKNDFDKLLKHIEDNYIEIKKEQNLAQSKKICKDKEEEKYFSDYFGQFVKLDSGFSPSMSNIKDMIYLEVIEESFVMDKLKEFRKKGIKKWIQEKLG